jgi:hypothetical protein
MVRTSTVALTVLLLMSGSSLALAQSSQSSDQNGRFGYGYGYGDGHPDWSGQGRFDDRYAEGGRYRSGRRDWSRNGQTADDRRFDGGQDRFGYGSNDDPWRAGAEGRSGGDRYGRYGSDGSYGRSARNAQSSYDGSDRQSGGQGYGWQDNSSQGHARQEPGGRDFGNNERTKVASANAAVDLQGAPGELRRELRQYGLQNIKILDTSYLVQARLPSGRTILLIADPPNDSASASADTVGSGRTGGGSSSAARSDVGSDQGQAARASQSQSQVQNRSQSSSRSTSQNGPDNSVLGGVSASEVRASLQARGFSDIQNLHKDGSTYVGQADWYGDQVDFRVDGRNGYVIEPNHMTSDQVQTMLDDEGWTNVRILQEGEKSYKLKATKNGINYQLRVDAETGEVYRQAAMNPQNSSEEQTGSVKPGGSTGSGASGQPATSGSDDSDANQSNQ